MKGAPQVRPAGAGAGSAPLVVARPRPVRRRPDPSARTAPAAPAVPVDSRIQARREAVAREHASRRFRRLIWLGGAVGLIAVVLGVTRTPLLDLDHLELQAGPSAVELSDPERSQLHEVLQGAGLDPGRPLVDLDLSRAEAALEAVPWVADATFERRWPGTVEVGVTRRVPVATLPVAGGWALVDRSGQVTTVSTAPPAGLVAVQGPGALSPGDHLRRDADALLAVAEAMPEALATTVVLIATGDGGSVELQLRDGGVVAFGPPDEVDEKLRATVTMLTQVDRTCLRVLDVSVPSVPTVTRDPGC